MNYQRGYTAVEVAVAIFFIAIMSFAITGWVVNIVKIARVCCEHIDGMMVIRIVGIFIAPLGSIMGYL